MPWLKYRALGSRPARAIERSRSADWLAALAAAKAGSFASARRIASSRVMETGAPAAGAVGRQQRRCLSVGTGIAPTDGPTRQKEKKCAVPEY